VEWVREPEEELLLSGNGASSDSLVPHTLFGEIIMTTTTNGQVRKSLASQLDRLDTLSEGLNEAVAYAVEQSVQKAVSVAVREAVQALLAEVLTNPDLRAALASVVGGNATDHATTAAPVSDRRPSLLSPAWRWLLSGLRFVRDACGHCISAVAGCLPLVRTGWDIASRHKRRVLAACGIGVVVSLGVYFAGPWLGAIAGWVGGFMATLAVQARQALKRLFGASPKPM
jgi:hypothetical protein